MTNETKGMFFGIAGVSAFGLTLPATRMIVPFFSPVFIGMGRAVFAALCAALLILWLRPALPKPKQLFELFIVALGVVIGFPLFSSWAMQYTPASHGAVVLGILPLATAVIGVIIGHERPSLAFWVVGISGSLLVVFYALMQGAGEIQLADIALLAAVLLAAIGYGVGAKLTKELGGWQVICWALLLALPLTLLPAISYAPDSFVALPIKAYVGFFYLALVSQLLGFFVWYKGLALGGIARVSQTQLLQPFVTILASLTLLGETIDTETVIFTLLVVSSVWLGKRMPIRQKVGNG